MRTTHAGHWITIERQIARRAAAKTDANQRHGRFMRQVSEIWRDRTAEQLDANAPDHAVCEAADRKAQLMADRVSRLDDMDPAALRAWLNDNVQALGARPFAGFTCDRPEQAQAQGMRRRACCPLWWRRQLRRAVVRRAETEGIAAGRVCARARQWYVTDGTVRRRIAQAERNAAMMAATELENSDGECFTLAALVAKSPSAKPIRRGELMTRIRGCEEWAQAAGMVGVFTTNTAPSRFHSMLMAGGRNPAHTDETPRDAQEWLCKTWARCRAALQRKGVPVFGFRVAEPHHDGCPHWHMLLWCAPEHRDQLEAIMRAAWLKHEGDEPGAQAHRCKVKTMTSGDAAGYVAKYIAKNIDDAGSIGDEGHRDEYAGDELRAHDGDKAAQGELFGQGARRVEAWAAAWAIRQFQAIGQPPVTVWRELRRIEPEAVAAASTRVQLAHEAAHRKGDARACWMTYMQAQGGAMQGRGYVLRLGVEVRTKEGRYETTEAECPVGVLDADRAGALVPSNRREWRPKGEWRGERTPGKGAAKRAPSPPWTRFNNCTHRPRGPVATIYEMHPAPMFGKPGAAAEWAAKLKERGGVIQRAPHHAEKHPPPDRNCSRAARHQ